MKSHQAGVPLNAVDQRRQVRKTAKEFGLGADQRVIELVDDAVTARAACHGDQAGHLVIGKQGVDIAGTFGVGACKVAVAAAGMGADLDLKAQSLQGLDRQLHGLALKSCAGRAE